MRLIGELLDACLDGKISVTNLLRKAKTVAEKHNMEGLLEWVRFELEGYDWDDVEQMQKFPDYRLIRTRIVRVALSIRYINHPESEIRTPVFDPISEIEQYASGSANDLPHIQIDSSTMVYYLSTERAEYGKILKAVRDRIVTEVSIHPQATKIIKAKRPRWKKVGLWACLCAGSIIVSILVIIFQESWTIKGIATVAGILGGLGGGLAAIWSALRKKS